MKDLSYNFCVSDQCISQIIFETCTVIWSVLKDVAMQPMNEDLWLRSAAEFEWLWNLPHCIAALDGKHVRNRVIHLTNWSD